MTVAVRKKGGVNHKYEIFKGQLFPFERFTGLLGEELGPEDALFRLRKDGVWMPLNMKVMYTREEIYAIFEEILGV